MHAVNFGKVSVRLPVALLILPALFSQLLDLFPRCDTVSNVVVVASSLRYHGHHDHEYLH